MRNTPSSESGLFNPRTVIALVLCSMGVSLTVFSFAATSSISGDWMQLNPISSTNPNVPGVRYDAGFAEHSTGAANVLFGGFGISCVHYSDPIGFTGDFQCSDTWTWDGARWLKRSPSLSPSQRYGLQMADDPASNGVLLFGGLQNNPASAQELGDTWTWNGSNWTLRTPAVSPPPTGLGMMAYHAAARQDVLFGGYICNVFPTCLSTQTWTWNGTIWSLQMPAVSPPARALATMAYHPPTGQVVLFGGVNGSGVLDDTWTWDGANWTQKFPLHRPSPRMEVRMAYDAPSGQLVLFGGTDRYYTVIYADTWRWDGSDWVQEQPATVPLKRFKQMMAQDSVSGHAMMFGGYAGTQYDAINDTWKWLTPPATVPLVRVVSRKAHGTAGPFDVELPIIGSPGIECRAGGANGDYTLVFSFANPLTNVTGASVTSGAGSVSNSAIGSDAHQYIVNLTGVTNAQNITVALTNVTDSAGNSSSIVSASMAVLIGDTNADGFVNSGDIAQTKSQSGIAVSASNFREDVTADGFLNSGDIALVKSKSGTASP